MEEFRGMVKAELKNLDDKVDRNSERIYHLEERTSNMLSFSKLLEAEMENSKKMQETLSVQHTTLVKINENLTNLNTNFDKLDERVFVLEKKEIENGAVKKKNDSDDSFVQKHNAKIIFGLVAIIATLLGIQLPL